MIDITHKISTHRKAVAGALLKVSCKETLELVKNKQVPKGDVFEFARAAALLAVKQTGHVIPDCHPMPIERTVLTCELRSDGIAITCEVETVYKTGVEMEALHGATVAALTMFDMLKPHDKGMEITGVKVIEKTGGKSDYNWDDLKGIDATVVVCSDRVSAGKAEDKSGKLIAEKLGKWKIKVNTVEIIPDDFSAIQESVHRVCAAKTRLLIFTGGTGLSTRDRTPEAVAPLLDREIPGIMENARSFGQERMPFSMLSRGVAGIKDETLILTLPGSVKGARDHMDSLFPYVLHLFSVMKNNGH